MPFECDQVVVLPVKHHAAYMYLQFIQHWLLLWKPLAKLKDLCRHWQTRLETGIICMAYTKNILGICHVTVYARYFRYEVLRENYTFLNISCFNIRLSSTIMMALVYSIAFSAHKSMKKKFNTSWHDIQCIYLVYYSTVRYTMIYQVTRAGSHSIYRRRSEYAAWYMIP